MMGSIIDMSVAAARDNEDVFARLTEMTGLSARKLANRLQTLDGRTRLRNAFAKELPVTYEAFSKVNVKQARTWDLGGEIARIWDLPGERVEHVLASVHGRTLIPRAFRLDEPEEDDDAQESDELAESAVTAGAEEHGPPHDLKLCRACVYAIVDEDILLAADEGHAPSQTLMEGKSWAAVTKWMESARALGERVPIVFADAKYVHRWLGWAVLADVEIVRQGEHKFQTSYRFQHLRPFVGHQRSDFLLLDQATPLSDAHIRSYVRFATPDFLHDLAARVDAPLLSAWLQHTEAVAHVFETAFDDGPARQTALDVLGRAIAIVDDVAPGNWGVVLTPGRIRVHVGEDVVVDVGNSPGEFVFWFLSDPSKPADEDDIGDLPLAECFQQHEADFRRKVEAVRSSPRFDRHDEVVLDYLRALGALPAQWSRAPAREDHGPGAAATGTASTSLRAGSSETVSAWSRPRPVRALLAQVGLPVPSELGQDEFGALIEALEARGFEVATLDGVHLSPLHDAVSLDDELRVRHDALAAAPTSQGSVVARHPEDGGPRQAHLGDYERASLGLTLLTAGLGRASPERLASCVETATAGLAVEGAKRALLLRLAEALAEPARDPLVVLTGLVHRIHPEDGKVLLSAFAALHPEREELNELMAEHWAALCGAGGGPGH